MRKGIGDIKGSRAIKGSRNIKTGRGQMSKGDSVLNLFQLNVEKDILTKKFEHIKEQGDKIEKRLSEITAAIQSEISQIEEPQDKGQEESTVPIEKSQNKVQEGSSMPEKDENQKGKIDKKGEINFGLGKFSFSDILQGIGSVVDFVSRMEEEGKEEKSFEREFTSPSSRVKAVYGFSVKAGPHGMPTVEPFGNVRKTAQGPVVEEERQPLVDIFDEKDHVLVIIELPGVEEAQIHTEVMGDILTISAAGRSHKYAREVLLPEEVDASTIKSKYRNGILEIRAEKKQHG